MHYLDNSATTKPFNESIQAMVAVMQDEYFRSLSEVDKEYIASKILDDVKGRMLEELLEVIAQNDRFELRIGGFGVLEDLVKQYAQENENIIFYGKLPYNEVLRYENQCHIMTAIYDPTVTNHIYAAPNKFYEALMLGKPLIMVKGTGMSKVIEENPIGVLIDYNMQSFHNALEELKDKRLHWPEMASKMKELYKSYSWDKMEERLLQLYASLTE